MCSSSTATAAATRRGSESSAAVRKTSTGRSRLPPAVSIAAACSSSSGPWPRGHLGEPLLGALERRGQRRPARGEHRAELRLGRGHARAPACRAMMPPAVSTQRTSVSPAAASSAASASGPGKRRTELGR